MATDYGTDYSTFTDLDETFTPRRGKRVVAERLARWFLTPRGQQEFYPDRGFDLRQFLSEGFTDGIAFMICSGMEREAEKDEAVEEATAKIELFDAGERMKVTLDVTTGEGPFTMTLNVTAVTVELLEAAA